MTERRPFGALIVDYGGVLTTSLAQSMAAFCLSAGVSPERLKSVLATAYGAVAATGVRPNDLHDLVSAVETGRLEPEEFERRLAVALSEGLPEPIEPQGLTERLFAQLRPDEKMRSAVGLARKNGIRTGLISNTWGIHLQPDVEGMFDAIVLSGREGLRKPDPEIFRLAARRIREQPEACVFVDDVPVNVEGARAAGMAGVLHKDSAITIPKLEELFGVPLAD